MSRPRGNVTLAGALQEFESILDHEKKAQFQATTPFCTLPNANDVISFAAELDLKDSKRTSRKLSKWFQPYMEFLQRFSGIVDSAIQANPKVAALVWASAKFAIMVSVDWNVSRSWSLQRSVLMSITPRSLSTIPSTLTR